MDVTPAIEPQSKAGASYKPKPRPSSDHLLLVEKGALAGICVVLVLSLVRVVVCLVLGLFVERCNGVAV